MKFNLLLLLFFFTTFFIYTQEAIVTSGGNATGAGSSSFTIGQTFVVSSTGSNGSVSEGIQKSLEIFTLSNQNLEVVKLKAITYPNPTKDKIILSLSENQFRTLSYDLYDINGKTVKKGKVNSVDTSIQMKQFTTGVYFLKVYENAKPLRVFKIVKN